MLRDYQQRLYTEAKDALSSTVRRQHLYEDGSSRILDDPVHSVCVQLPTGGGKTPLSSEIIRSSFSKGRRVWTVAPRNELVGQASEHLQKWSVPHGIIAAGIEESRAYMVHAVSKDTLLRRLDRIKNWPDLLFFDEAHIALDAQKRIIAAANEARAALGLPPIKVIGQTATPERLDGRGLSEVYDVLVQGPSIPWLTDRGFLSPLRYFAPPIEGLEKIHRKGTEFDADDLEALLEKRKVYGDVIKYYQKYGTVKHEGLSLPGAPTVRTNENYAKGKPALIFCRSVKSAYETAERFCKAGFNFQCIEGNLPAAEVKLLVKALRDGKIDGLTNCDLATYGLDVPRIEYVASIRPTLSRALYFQMIGRGLRPFEGKQECLVFDHVNLVQEHQLPEYPGTPLFYLDNIQWNFDGRKKRERAPLEARLTQCPLLAYEWCRKPTCAGCTLKKEGDPDPRKLGLPEVDAKLEERTAPTRFADLMPEEKKDVQDRIGRATEAALASEGAALSGPIGELLAVAIELGRSPMWVYYWLTEKENARRLEEGKGPRLTVNAPLLHEIARQMGYKPGWAWHKQQEIKAGKKEEAVV